MLDVTRLRVLAAVARHGSVTAAAKALNYAQPSVSHHLARLEAETGTQLVERAGRGVRLTDAGRLLAGRAEEILGRLDAAEHELAAHIGQREERIIIHSVQDGALVNALQRRAAVVLQKSIREGFGLTVSEAMWKETPVIGGNVGGIRYQIEDGVNGFLVNNIEETADRIVRLLKDSKLREHMGKQARETVREKFLLTRYLEQYIDLFNSFEPSFRLVSNPEKK